MRKRRNNKRFNPADRIQRTLALRQRIMQNAEIENAARRLGAVLDGLNVFGLLESHQRRPPKGMLCFGPKSVFGRTPSTWAAVVIWYRPPGYHQYRTLHLLGIWAQTTEGDITILAGKQNLGFRAAHYNAESYFTHLPGDFQIYYGRIETPPANDQVLYTERYDPLRRLALRFELDRVIGRWAAGHAEPHESG